MIHYLIFAAIKRPGFLAGWPLAGLGDIKDSALRS